jgi:cardiolipin synthase A/B
MNTYWQSEEIFFDGDAYFERIMQDIDQAKTLITLEIYIFNDDLLGQKMAAHLISAHKRGVKVEIIVDGIGSFDFADRLHGIFSKWGLKVKLYHPLPFIHPYQGRMNFFKKIETIFLRLGRLNRRNHRKIITIDEEIMYTGSFNITAEHTKYHHDTKWQDLGARVTGSNVSYAVLSFKKLWKIREYYKYRKKIKYSNRSWKKSPIRLNQSIYMKHFYYKDLINKIEQARGRIWLITPYFIPKGSIIRALGRAAGRGVDVQLLISFKSDVKIFQSLQYFYYPFLINKGIKIHQHIETVLHAKNYIIDDWMTIGTSNLNHRSFMHDLEVDLVIQKPENREYIKNNFLKICKTQREITAEHLKQRSLFDKFLCRLFFLFKYWF